MPTQIQIQNTILSASLDLANKVEAKRLLLAGGVSKGSIDWQPLRFYQLLIRALQRQFDLGDYTSDGVVKVYDCLCEKIGYDTTVITIDPNYQPNDSTIVVVNPTTYIAPIKFGWADFSTDNSPDGGVTRNIFYRPEWMGIDPFLSLISPAEGGLTLGLDYALLASGGITILDTSIVLPGIGNGAGIIESQVLWASSYKTA